MESKFKLTEKELEEFERVSDKSPLLRKAFELIEIIQLNIVSDTLIALKKTHLGICDELIAQKKTMFNDEKFDSFIKWSKEIEDTVKTIKSLEASLTPEEVKEVNKKMKDSQQLFIPKTNGAKAEN